MTFPETEQRESTTLEQDEQSQDQDERVGIMINVPAALATLVKQTAESAQESTSSYVRRLLADHVGYEGPLGRKRRIRKYANEDERKEAQKQRQKHKREVMKKLMEQYGDLIEQEIEEREKQETT